MIFLPPSPARNRRAALAVAGTLVVVGFVLAAWWRREPPSPAAPGTAVQSGAPHGRTSRRSDAELRSRRARRRNVSARPAAADRIHRTFLGQPGWLVVGQAALGEDEAMWAARAAEDRGIEATAVAGELFAGLDPDTTYLVYGAYAAKQAARDRADALRDKGITAHAVESGPVRAAGEGATAPARLTAVRGLVTDDGQPAAYHVSREFESTEGDRVALGAIMPDPRGRFMFWTNRIGTITLDINLPLELDRTKSAGDGAFVDLDAAGPAIIDVELQAGSNPASAP